MSSEETPEAKAEETTPDAAPEATASTDSAAPETPAGETAEAPAAEPAADAPAAEPVADAPVAGADVPAAAKSDDDTIRSTTYEAPVVTEGAAPEPEGPEVVEKVVSINRCAKVVKGGRRFSFSALVVAGDHAGNVGFGFGKANEVAECIRKASDSAKVSLEPVELNGSTIPHEVIGEFGGGKVLLRPATPGTGIIAGSSVRSVVEAAGIKDILTKSLGSNNHFNVVKATLEGLRSLRTKEQVYKLRGKKTADSKAI